MSPPLNLTWTPKRQKNKYFTLSESYPSFSHNCCQVKRSKGHNMEKMLWSKNAIDLQMCVKYYCRGRSRGASQTAGTTRANKTTKSVKHISLSGEPPEEPKKSTSAFMKHQGYGEVKRRAVTAHSYHQRAATVPVWERVLCAGWPTFFHNVSFCILFFAISVLNRSYWWEYTSNN